MIRNIIEGVGFDFCAFVDYDSNADACLYEIGNYACEPEYSYGPIIRPRGIIHFVTSGKGKLTIEDRVYNVHKDQIFFIPAGVSAYYIADKNDPWSYMWLHIGGSRVIEVLKDAGIDEYNPVFSICDRGTSTKDNFYKILSDIFSNFTREFLCISKIYELLDYFSEFSLRDTESFDNLQLQYVHTVIKYIHLKYSEQIHVTDISRACGLNRSYLSRLFHDATGSTIQDFLMTYRIKEAQNMLKNTSSTISYIAFAVGYTDIYNFSKAFKKKTGMTPSKYREQEVG